MFFIMGVSQGQRKLDFDQLVVCRNCGKYGHLEVYMVYSCLSLFFIPVFKWGRSYYVRTTCCGRTVPVSADLGRAIASGEVTSLPEDIIPEGYGYGSQGFGWQKEAGGYGSRPGAGESGSRIGEASPGGRTSQDDAAGRSTGGGKHCNVCGFETSEDYQFCPKCGTRL